MPEPFVSLTPAELTPTVMYDLLTGTVQPRPIAFVSTISPEGVANLAPFSFFMVGGSNPPSLMVSPVLGPGGKKKDSLRNIEATGEFVVNALHRAMSEGMNQASYPFPSDQSEWAATGFTQAASQVVAPSRVAESLAQFECQLFQVVEHGCEAGAARYVIGEIVAVHVHPDLWNDGAFAAGSFRPISRMGGPEYLDTANGEIFSLERPTGIKP